MKLYFQFFYVSKLLVGTMLLFAFKSDLIANSLHVLNKPLEFLFNLNNKDSIVGRSINSDLARSYLLDNELPLNRPPELRYLRNSVYFIKITTIQVYFTQTREVIDISKYGLTWSGTGFLLDNGDFITARHVIQPWRFIDQCRSWNLENEKGEAILAYINNAEIAGGSVEIIYEARSGDGDIFTFSNKDVVFDQSGDKLIDCESEGSEKQLKICPIYNSASDWAKLTLNNRKGLLKLNRDISRTLGQETLIYGYGYSYGQFLQAFTQDRIAPILIKGEIVQDRTINGMINISANSIAPGSSGGPMMIKNANGEYEVIGIISRGFVQVQQLVPAYEIR